MALKQNKINISFVCKVYHVEDDDDDDDDDDDILYHVLWTLPLLKTFLSQKCFAEGEAYYNVFIYLPFKI